MKRKKTILVAVIATGAILMGLGGYMIWKPLNEYGEGESVYEELLQFVSLPNAQVAAAPEGGDAPDPDVAWPEVDFDSLQAVNPDIVGWLYSEDTPINYPVVQSQDNEYYLKHLFDRSRNSAGCLFVDVTNSPDFGDHNTIIYGHHLRSGTMLSSIDKYKAQEYYDAHPTMLLLTPEGNFVVELFAGHVARTDSESWVISYGSQAHWAEWLEAQISVSTFQSGVEPSYQDRLLTLSTCSYEFNDARYVLYGILRAV